MCTVSMIGDDFHKRWPQNPVNPWREIDPTNYPNNTPIRALLPEISRIEFDALKKEVEALKKLLEAANKYDQETGQPDCHMDEKVNLIKRLAEITGVDMKDVF